MRLMIYYSLSILILVVPGCMQVSQKQLTKKVSAHSPSLIASLEKTHQCEDPAVTIWIHGTRLLPKNMFQRYFFCKQGLHHFSELDSYYHIHKIAATISASDPALFPAQTFYLFGWSGLLSFKEREAAAHDLYVALKKVREEYKMNYGHEPTIRIIAHSHGGNVALLLEKVKDEEDTSFCITDLILLACPVQSQTMHYAASPTFGKVYSLFSLLDVMQVVDPQGLQKESKMEKVPLFSQRYFPHHEKIEQVAIKKNNRSIMHIEFIQLNFVAQLPYLISEINKWRIENPIADWHCRTKCLCIDTSKKHRAELCAQS